MPDRTKMQTQIDLMSALERGEVVSQKALSQRLSVSVGLVNLLLRRITQKGYVKAKSVPYRRWAYYLTPSGFAEKSRLVAMYLESSLGFFRKARQEYADLFTQLGASGTKRVVLVGRGELVEIAILAARETDIEIVGLLDRESNTESVHGLAVLRSLDKLRPRTALVVTASRHPQRTYDEVLPICGDLKIVAPSFLHIVDRNAVGMSLPIAMESEQ